MRWRSLIFSLAVIAAVCICPSVCRATAFMPVVTNYTAKDYRSGLQNWALAQGPNGEMYVGNNTGLLCFDGYMWTKYPMPGSQTVRSVLVDGDRIYVGAYEDFGYFTRNSFGSLEYTSLWSRPENGETHNDEIWNILKAGGSIYFQSFSSWFRYDGQKVTAHYDPDRLPLYFHQAHGNIYVQLVNGDFCLLENDEYKPLITREALGGDAVVALIPTSGGRMILCTEWHGLFDYDGRKLTPRLTGIDGELKNRQVNRAVMIPSDSTIVIGTIRNGIYAIDSKGRQRWHCNVSNRLCNNSVLRLFCDRDNNVWAALDTGIALIHTGSPFSALIPGRNSQSLGMVYGVNAFNGNLYIATNQSAWLYPFTTETIVPIQGAEGHNWHVTAFDSQVLLGNNFGTKAIEGAVAYGIPGVETGSTCLRKCVINEQEVLLESSYYDLRIYRKTGGKWTFSHAVDGFRSPVRQFEVDHSGTIWAAHMSLGIYKITLSKDLHKVAGCDYIKSLSDNAKGRSLMHVVKIRGRVVFSDSEKTYTYDDIKQAIVPFTQLNAILHGGINSAASVDDNTYWLADHRGYSLIRYDKGRFVLVRFVPASFFGLECNENNSHVYVDDDIVYFCLNNGVGRLDMRHAEVEAGEGRALQISAVTSLSRDHSLHLLPVTSGKEANEKVRGDVTFRLSYPDFNGESLTFHYCLAGGSPALESTSAQPVVTYGSLEYGDYRFTASVKSIDGRELGFAEYYFCKPRPFYLSVYAWAAYLFLALVLVFLYSRWHTSRMMRKRNKEYEEEKIKQDFKMLEQEHIIARQRQQLLESELSAKGKELASLALDAVASNKAVESLREAMLQQERKGSVSRRDVEAILSQISGSVNDEEFWDIYRKNFDLIHKNFFRNLRKQYPTLTPGDLKFCALLRLNLSTKDIAQFTNLTVRGVEAARYRLRKKLSIPEGSTLVDFLIDFE